MDVTLLLPLLLLLLDVFPGVRQLGEAASAAQEIAVRRKILTSYDRSQLPPGGPARVRMYAEVTYIDLYAHGNSLEVGGLFYIAWTDTRLSWTDADVSHVDVYSDEIWLPDLGVLHGWRDDPYQVSLPRTRCVLSSTGYVECMPPGDMWASCGDDVSRWPYTQHNCSIRLTSQLRSDQLQFELQGVSFVYELAERNWKNLQISSYTEEVEGRSNVVISFLVQQLSTLETATFVAPALVLAALSVSTWLLPAMCSERLLLATLSVFFHCTVINALSYAGPENAEKPPQVVLLYRDLLLVAAVSFVAAVALRGLNSLRTLTNPAWLPSLLASTAGRFLLCAPQGSFRLQEEDDAEGLVNEDETPTANKVPAEAPLVLLTNRVGLAASAGTCIAALFIRLVA